MDSSHILVVLIVLLALAFDYTNGFHDAANSIATVVSTRVLSPGKAVALAAFFNFIAFFFAGHHVASTIGKGLINVNMVDQWVILAGLVGAITWNLLTWYFGLPTSSSHALVGAYAGAAVTKVGFGALIWHLSDWPKGRSRSSVSLNSKSASMSIARSRSCALNASMDSWQPTMTLASTQT